MAITRTTPAAVGISTALNSLANNAAAQTAEVTPSTSTNLVDIVASWQIALGAISPGATTDVLVYVWGTNDDSGYPGGSTGNEVITGSAGSITLSSNGQAALRPLRSTLGVSASSTVRDEASIVEALGFVPRRWGLVFWNKTGQAFGSSGHAVEYVETYYTA